MNSRILSVLAIAAVLCCGIAEAQIPRKLNYQGFLTSPSGAPINASVQMVFTIYPAATGPASVHTETQTVAVSNGIFNVVLGTNATLSAAFDTSYWLGVAVGADPEMAPRQPLAASPYAVRSASAESLAATATVSGSQITGAISTATLPTANLTGTLATAQFANASVTAAKLASNSCISGQVLQYNGSTWVCATPSGSSSGTVTSITAGTGLTGGTITTTGTIGLGTVPEANGGTGSTTQNFVDLSTNQNAIGGNKTFTVTQAVSTAFTVEARHNNTGFNNLFIGGSAGAANTTANFNTAVGTSALSTNTAGAQNTAIGNAALSSNVTGNSNTAAGDGALQLNKGNQNTAFG